MARDPRNIEDELLALRCRRGETRAFDELFRLWEARLFYYVRRLVPQEVDAWDVLQKTWIEVLRGIHRLRDAEALRVWLYRVARNVAVSHCRLEIKHRADPEANGEVVDAFAGDDLVRAENAEFIHHGLNRLPLPGREILTLYFLEDLSIEEIATLLEIPAGTVKSRLHHARNALRKILHSQEQEP